MPHLAKASQKHLTDDHEIKGSIIFGKTGHKLPTCLKKRYLGENWGALFLRSYCDLSC